MFTSPTPIALVDLALYGEDANILKGIQRYSHLVGDWIVETAAHDVWAFDFAHLKRSPKGIIGHIAQDGLVELLQDSGIPVVNLSGIMPESLPFHHVGVDQTLIGKRAAEHLLGLGLEYFAIPARPGQVSYQFLNERLEGFIATLTGAGIQDIYQLEHLSELPGFEPVSTSPLPDAQSRCSLQDLPRPCGIFSLTDRMGLSIQEDCLSLGIRVPEEMSILGAGNLEILCEFSHPSLSSIEPPMEGVGFEAARTLHLLMQGHSPRRVHKLKGPIRLKTRASTSQMMVNDPLVRQALTFIRDHVRKGINVADVAEHCQGTRRNLEIRFRDVTGESLLDRIHKARLHLAQELLEHTQEPISLISSSCGYSNPEHMSRAFKRYLGKSPREIRQEYGSPSL